MSRFLTMLTATLLLCGAAWAEEGRPLRIAVVDISKVFNSYKKTEKVKEQIEVRFDARGKALEERKKKLIERERALREDTRSPDDPQVLKEREQFIKDARAFEADTFVFERELAEFNLENTKEIMADIEAAVQRYASKKGYDLVLKHQPAQEAARSKAQLMVQVGANPVLFFSPSIDITEGIVTLLNLAYEQGKSLVPKERSAEKE